MLGNDVVDLLDAESQPETFRPRFDERAFTDAERDSIARDRNPLALRWAYWAAKESAYKLVKQIDDSFVFAPGRTEIEFEPLRRAVDREAHRSGFVQWRHEESAGSSATRGKQGKQAGEANSPNALVALGQIEVRSYETDDYVHVMALPEGADWDAVDWRVAPLDSPDADPSEAVRALAIGEVARNLGVEAARLQIGVQHATSRVPIVELDCAPTSVSLSLSHHGRFISYAMRPRSERSGITETDLVILPAVARSGALFL